MSSMQTGVEAVRKSLVVNCDQQTAFETFTRDVGTWWPLHSHSIGGKEITEVIWEEQAGGRIYERHADGGEGEWGRVVAWEPHSRFVMSWYPGKDDSMATELEVHFMPEGDATRVDLEHRGWEIFAAEGQETRDNYDNGWPTVLDCFERKLNG